MKTRRIFCLALVVVFAFALVACGGGGGNGIEGKWKFVSGESDYSEMGNFYMVFSGGKVTIEFDTTGLSEEEKASVEFAQSMMSLMEIKYKVVSDTQLEMTVSAFGESETDTVEYKIENNKLTFDGGVFERA